MTDKSNRLREAYQINLRDAETLVSIMERDGDADSLRRAREDLEHWRRQLTTMQEDDKR